MAVQVLPYESEWLPQLAALARAHARLVPPWISLDDDDVQRGLVQHAAWPFYSPGLEEAQLLLAVDGDQLLAAGQMGMVETGWGYGAAPGDGPDWLYRTHASLYWLFCWPGWEQAQEGAAAIAARAVGWTRGEGLPGLEAFRGGPGFLPFGTQLSRYWPHLWAPLRATGFRQPRNLLVFSGETDPEGLPVLDPLPQGVTLRQRRGRIEAWCEGEPVGICSGAALEESWSWRRGGRGERFADRRLEDWAVIRRLFVDSSARGTGIGSALFAAQLEALAGRGFKRYLLHIPDDPQDAPAMRLYARFGRLLDAQHVLRVSF